MIIEQRIAKMEDEPDDINQLGKPSAYVCPECQGTLFEIHPGNIRRFRCRIGHAYSEGALLAEQANSTEDALWTAMRSLREQADLLRTRAGEQPASSSYRKRLQEFSRLAEEQAAQVRDIIEKNGDSLAGLRDRLKKKSRGGASRARGSVEREERGAPLER